jgi:hypothetical protein
METQLRRAVKDWSSFHMMNDILPGEEEPCFVVACSSAPVAFQTPSMVRSARLRGSAFRLKKALSIGLKPGLWL